MAETTNDRLAKQIYRSFEMRDVEAFGALLADDVRWGDDLNPKKCRGRQDVVATFQRLLDNGIDGKIIYAISTPNGVVCKLEVNSQIEAGEHFRRLYHFYQITKGMITEIMPFENRTEVERAAGLGSHQLP